jgi:hypothetical protein
MTLQEIIVAVAESPREDWNIVPLRGANAECAGDLLDQGRHKMAAVYVPNPLIRLEWGMTFNSQFEEPWANRFADRHARGELVEICYAGAPVYQDAYVVVDGGRALLPLPSPEELTVAPAQKRFIRLVDSLEGDFHRFDYCLQRAGITEGNDPWPVFDRV